MSADKPPGEEHLIHVEDEEVTVEYHPEDWLAIVIFWGLSFIVFLQFFTRYVMNDSLAWTEEIARYCADLGRVRRRRDGDAPQLAHRGRTAVEPSAAERDARTRCSPSSIS